MPFAINGKFNSSGGSGAAALPSFTGNAGKVLAVNVGETATEWIAVAGTGTVTSVAMTAPGFLSVAGSPITAAGTLAVTLATQAKNLVFSGPATGADAAPTFRALSVLDLPQAAADLGAADITVNLTNSHAAQVTNLTTDGTITAGTFSGAGTSLTGTAASLTAGNATAAADGLTSASGTAPLTLTLGSKALTGSVAAATGATISVPGTAGVLPAPPAGTVTDVLRRDLTWGSAGGGGITNSASANVVTKSNGTNVVASTITDDATTLTLGNAGVTVTEATGAVALTAQAATTVPLTVQGASAQSVAPLMVKDSAGTTYVGVGSDFKSLRLRVAGGTEQSFTARIGDVFINSIYFGANGALTVASIGGYNGGLSPKIDLNTSYRVFISDQYGTHYDFNDNTGTVTFGLAAATTLAWTHRLAASSRSGTDTNTAGANATVTSGTGTGAATGSTLTLSTPTKGSTGTAAQTQTARVTISEPQTNVSNALRLGSATVGTQMITSTKTLTNNSATGVFDITVPSNGGCGGMLGYTAIITGTGPQTQAYNGLINWASASVAGTITTAITEGSTTGSHDAKALSTGTVSGTWTNVAGSGKSTLTVNVNSDLTSPVVNIYLWLKLDGSAGCVATAL